MEIEDFWFLVRRNYWLFRERMWTSEDFIWRRFHGKESSPVEAICELGLERLEAVCSLWIVELPQDVSCSSASLGVNEPSIFSSDEIFQPFTFVHLSGSSSAFLSTKAQGNKRTETGTPRGVPVESSLELIGMPIPADFQRRLILWVRDETSLPGKSAGMRMTQTTRSLSPR